MSEEDFEVEAILAHQRTGKDSISYLVTWVGYGPEYNCFVLDEDISADDLIDEYWEKVHESYGQKKSSKMRDTTYTTKSSKIQKTSGKLSLERSQKTTEKKTSGKNRKSSGKRLEKLSQDQMPKMIESQLLVIPSDPCLSLESPLEVGVKNKIEEVYQETVQSEPVARNETGEVEHEVEGVKQDQPSSVTVACFQHEYGNSNYLKEEPNHVGLVDQQTNQPVSAVRHEIREVKHEVFGVEQIQASVVTVAYFQNEYGNYNYLKIESNDPVDVHLKSDTASFQQPERIREVEDDQVSVETTPCYLNKDGVCVHVKEEQDLGELEPIIVVDSDENTVGTSGTMEQFFEEHEPVTVTTLNQNGGTSGTMEQNETTGTFTPAPLSPTFPTFPWEQQGTSAQPQVQLPSVGPIPLFMNMYHPITMIPVPMIPNTEGLSFQAYTLERAPNTNQNQAKTLNFRDSVFSEVSKIL